MEATWYFKLVGVSWFLLVVMISACPVKGQTIDDMISREWDRVDVPVAPNGHRSGVLSFPSRNSSKTFYLMQLDMIITAKQWNRIKAANTPKSNGTLSRQKRKGTKFRDMLWKEGKVPYEITEGDFDDSEKNVIYEAFDVWQTYTCVVFTNTKNLEKRRRSRIRFREPTEGGCSSYVGQYSKNRAQDLNLGQFCRTKPIIVHEIGHALGLYHEHMRPDRKEYVKINMRNVRKGQTDNFLEMDETFLDVQTVPYDLVSIMHYGKLFMSKNRTAYLYTIEPHDDEYLDKIGKAESASFTDIKMVNHMYKCAARCASNITCPPDGFLGKDCRCFCPSNSNAVVDCRDRNRCEPPDDTGPYIYVHTQGEEVYPDEARIVENTEIYVLCKGDTSTSLVGNLTCINGGWTGDLPDCISDPQEERTCRVRSIDPATFDIWTAGLIKRITTTTGQFKADDKLLIFCWDNNRFIVTCQENGTWDMWGDQCTPRRCTAPNVDIQEYDFINDALQLVDWDTDEFCNDCSILVSCRNSSVNSTLICRDTVWKGSIPDCKDWCEPPDDTGPYIYVHTQGALEEVHADEARIVEYTMIDVLCKGNTTYSLVGNLTCINGTWTGYLPDCISARCASNITCPQDGFLGKDCRCFCPSNSDGAAVVDCRDRNRCEPPDDTGPYIYLYAQGEEVYPDEARVVEYIMIDVFCKGDTSNSLVGNLTCINGGWTGDLPDCISDSREERTCTVTSIDPATFDIWTAGLIKRITTTTGQFKVDDKLLIFCWDKNRFIVTCQENGTWDMWGDQCTSNRCEPPDDTGPYVYVHTQGEEVHADEGRIVEYTMIDVFCKGDTSNSLVGNLTCINGGWTGYLPDCISDSREESTCTVTSIDPATFDIWTPGLIKRITTTTGQFKADDRLLIFCWDNNRFSVTCQENGTWDMWGDQCTPRRCTAPNVDIQEYDFINDALQLVDWDTDEFCNDCSILVSCRNSSVNSTLICRDTVWKGSIPDCKDWCEPPDDTGPYIYVHTQGALEEVHADEARIVEYTMIDVLCKGNTTYSLVGNLTCINGTWTGYLPDCISARCASNITCPPDGFLGKDCRCFCPSNSDGTAVVDCRDRNRCEPPDDTGPYIYVHTQGEWEEVDPDEARIVENTMIDVLCKGNTTYSLVGNLTCINGGWTGYLPDCISDPQEERTCTVTSIDPATFDIWTAGLIKRITTTTGQFKADDRLLIFCWDNNRFSVTCQENGTWDMWGDQCTPRRCTAPNVDIQEYDFINDALQLVDWDTDEFCNDYSILVSCRNSSVNSTLICRDTVWKGSIPDCKEYLGNAACVLTNLSSEAIQWLDPDSNDELPYGGTIEHGEMVFAVCEVPDYSYYGDNYMNYENYGEYISGAQRNITCVDGNLNGSLPTACHDTVGASNTCPPIVNGWKTKLFWNTYNVTCSAGYHQVRSVTRYTCTNGVWEPFAPSCEQDNCPLPDEYDGALINMLGNTMLDFSELKSGEMVRFRCPAETHPSETNIVCRNGHLNTSAGQLPECKKVECPLPNVVNVAYYPVKKVYTYKDQVFVGNCRGNLEFVGEKPLMCGIESTWSGNAECRPFCNGGRPAESVYNEKWIPEVNNPVEKKMRTLPQCVRKCVMYKKFLCRAVSFGRKGSHDVKNTCILHTVGPSDAQSQMKDRRGWKVVTLDC